MFTFILIDFLVTQYIAWYAPGVYPLMVAWTYILYCVSWTLVIWGDNKLAVPQDCYFVSIVTNKFSLFDVIEYKLLLYIL